MGRSPVRPPPSGAPKQGRSLLSHFNMPRGRPLAVDALNAMVLNHCLFVIKISIWFKHTVGRRGCKPWIALILRHSPGTLWRTQVCATAVHFCSFRVTDPRLVTTDEAHHGALAFPFPATYARTDDYPAPPWRDGSNISRLNSSSLRMRSASMRGCSASSSPATSAFCSTGISA